MKNKIHTFYQDELPNSATHLNQNECGFSIYRGALVQWDEDHDERVLEFLDHLPAFVLDGLLVVQEHEGSISFLWRDKIPKGYEEGECVDVPDGDVWCIVESRIVKPTTRQKQ